MRLLDIANSGLPLSRRPHRRRFGVGGGGGSFDPASLYSDSLGFFFDATSGLYQDDAATVPVTTAGQSVAVITDRTVGSNNFTQTTASARPTYQTESGLPYLLFDGTGDWMTSGVIGLFGTGRTVISAIRRLSDTTAGAVLESRPLWTGASGRFAQFSPSLATEARHGSRWMTSTVQSIVHSPASYPTPHTAVLTSAFATGSHVVRINGAQVASDAPGGVLDNHTSAMTIGSRDGTGLFFNGRIYAMLVIDRVLSGADLTNAEAWAASKCGVAL